MDTLLVNAAQDLLEDLRSMSGAANFTCYFWNQYSEVYWLFRADPRPDAIFHPELMAGPLTHPRQNERLKITRLPGSKVSKDNMAGTPALPIARGVEAWFYRPVPEEMMEDVLESPSFARREGVRHTIRLHFFNDEEVPTSESGIIAGSDFKCDVHIFLNFRDDFVQGDEEEWVAKFRSMLSTLRTVLLRLASSSRLDDRTAWRLRSVNVRFRKLLEKTMVTSGDKLREKVSELYAFIAEATEDLLRPLMSPGKGLLPVSLALVDSDNRIAVAAPRDKEAESRDGIIRFVARSGQMFLVRNVETYKAKVAKYRSEELDGQFPPEYICCNHDTLSELACPLIVQGRVVGVLNVESDTADAFDDGHALLLFLIASSAALAVRQVSLWKDLGHLISQQHELLNIDNDEGVLKRTVEAVRMLGFQTSRIWDFEAGWIPKDCDSNLDGPRDSGLTTFVRDSGRPFAFTNFKKDASGKLCFQMHVGRLDDSSKFFEDWEEYTVPEGLEASARLTEGFENGKMLTDLAFPIFAPGKSRQVRAVLWAKCQRLFTAILLDEVWSLTVLCQNASEALRGILARREMIEWERKLEQCLLEDQFGHERSKMLMSLDKTQRGEFLVRGENQVDVIVLNVDIRGSTAVGRSLEQDGNARLYLDFISEYHSLARRIVVNNHGVFDKTMGDGVMALWPVMPDPFGGDFFHDMATSRRTVLRAVTQLFDEFARLCNDTLFKFSVDIPPNFSLGAAIVEGKSFVGSEPNQKGSFSSYSALGDAANQAGKLAARARREELRSMMENANTRSRVTLFRAGDAEAGSVFRRAEGHEAPETEFKGAAPSWEQGLLLVSATAHTSASMPDSFEMLLAECSTRLWKFPATKLPETIPFLYPEEFRCTV